MLLEALVATTCLVEHNGCTETTGAYIKTNIELQETMSRVENIGQRIMDENKYLVYVMTPAAALAYGKPANFKLHRTLMLNVYLKEQAVALQWVW